MSEITDNAAKKEEFRGLLFFTILISLIFILFIYKKYALKNEGVYVVAKLEESFYAGTETGWVNRFGYFYNDRKHIAEIGASMNERVPRDSFIYMKVVRGKRIFYEGIFNVSVPHCISVLYEKGFYWNNMPNCQTILKP